MDFMDLAKPGEIKHHCDPNALATLQEYILDYGDDGLKASGEKTIEILMKSMDDLPRRTAGELIKRIKEGKT
jgi:2-iminoacetate synthase